MALKNPFKKSPKKTEPPQFEGRVFDRIPFKHPKQFLFPAKALVPEGVQTRTFRYWNLTAPYLDQGYEGACVGFAWTHWLNAGPVTVNPRRDDAYARQLYREAQKRDEWPGEQYEGSSVNGGALALRDEGYIAEFRWAWTVEQIAEVLLYVGPMVVGTDWYEGMMWPDEDGVLVPQGRIVGGHAYTIVGVNTERRMFKIRNSWGRGWGRGGSAWISFDDMQKLLDAQGEACIAVEAKKAQ